MLNPLSLTDTLHESGANMLLSNLTPSERAGFDAMDDAFFAEGYLAHCDVFVPILRQAKDQTTEYSTF